MQTETCKNPVILMTIPFPTLKTPLREHIPLLIKELQKQGWEIKTFFYGRRKPHCTLLEQVGGLILNLIGFIRLLYDKHIKIIQINSAFDRPALIRDLIFALAARLMNKYVFIKFHGSADDLLYHLHGFWYAWAHILCMLAHKIGLLSKKEEEDMQQRVCTRQLKLITVKNPIPADYLTKCLELRAKRVKTPIEIYSSASSLLPKELFRPTGCTNRSLILPPPCLTPVNIIFASRFMRRKGLFDLIEAVPHVCNRLSTGNTQVHFLLAGNGPDSELATSRIKVLRLTEKISCLGYLQPEKLQEVLAGTDIFVFPSYFPEGMPMALIHAMAAGNAIITTRVRFAQSYLKEPDNCLFVEPGRPERLATKILYLIRHPEIGSAMQIHNRRFLENYLAPAVSCEYINIYRELTAKV